MHYDTLTADQGHTAPTLDEIIHAHGASRVLWAALRALVRQRRKRARPPDADALPAYLRRDVGLPTLPEAADWTRYIP